MAGANQDCDPSFVALLDAATTQLILPDGYELVHYTLRRKHDGHLQSYLPVDTSVIAGHPVQAMPTVTPGSDMSLQDSQQTVQDHSITLSSQTSSSNAGPHPVQNPTQQLLNIPIRGGRKSQTQTLSLKTQKRHAHSGGNGYTDVCGVVCPELAVPVKKTNPGAGNFCCPRCGSNFTRPKSVKDHFPDCVLRYGNPQGLRYTDHDSMGLVEAAVQRKYGASRDSSNPIVKEDDTMTEADDQVIKLEEMSDTLSDAFIPSDSVSPRMKTEFVFGANIPLESIEQHSSNQSSSTVRGSPHTSHESAFNRSFLQGQTPDWGRALSPRLYSATPIRRTDSPSSAPSTSTNDYPYWDPRATAPYEYGLGLVEAQSPAPTNVNGFQGDGLDDFMDRRSYMSEAPTVDRESSGSPTPTPWHHGGRTPTPGTWQSPSRTPTPGLRHSSSYTLRLNSSGKTGGFDEEMEE